MAGEPLAAADVGWHGIAGDRRFAVRKLDDAGGFPWLSASGLADLLRFVPRIERDVATHVRTPDGRDLPIAGSELAAELSRLHGKPVQLMRLDHGTFDETPMSVITTTTIRAIEAACDRPHDVRRFRPNLVLHGETAFEEDGWIGRVLAFEGGLELAITMRDLRCVMINLDPDTIESDPRMLKAVGRMNETHAGVYATVLRGGRVAVGERCWLR